MHILWLANSRALSSCNAHKPITGLQNQNQKKTLVDNLLTSNICSLWENLKPQLCCIDLAIAW